MKLVEKIAMKISWEEYNDIFPVLKENQLVGNNVNEWREDLNYLVNQRRGDYKGVNLYNDLEDYKILSYNKELFLQYCGIDIEETLQEYINRVNSSLYSSFLAEKELKNRKSLYKTEDNVDVYENDIIHWVINNKEDIRFLYQLNFTKLHVGLLKDTDTKWKIFSTKEKAEEYVFENTTQRTFDGYNIKNREDMFVVDIKFFNLHQSIGGHYKKDNNKHLLFKHKGNAINYIVLNKKTLSLSDLNNISFNGDEKMRLIKYIKEKLGFI